jgi:hypothetical protein
MGYHEIDLGIDAGKTRVLETLVTRELVTSKLSLSFNPTVNNNHQLNKWPSDIKVVHLGLSTDYFHKKQLFN